KLRCDEVVGRRTARTAVLNDFVRNLLTFVERGKASALNGGDVNENVRATLVRLDEAEALGRVEPLNCSRSHGKFLCNISSRVVRMLRTRPCGSNLWTGDRQEARLAARVAKSLDRKIDALTICDK